MADPPAAPLAARETSLRSAAYALTRELGASPGGVALARLLDDLRAPFDARLATWAGRGTFRFAAARRAPGLAGYAAAARGAVPATGSASRGLGRERGEVPALAADEAALLIGAQARLAALARRGLAPLLDPYPSVWPLVNPSQFSPSRPPAVAGDDSDEPAGDDLWSSEAAAHVADALGTHPAPRLLLALADVAPEPRTLLSGAQAEAWARMERLRRALWYEGARGVPELWMDRMHLLPTTSPERHAFRAVAALLALRRSLVVLQLLVFQKLIGLKPVVSDDLVVSVPGRGWTEITTGSVVRLIPPAPGQRLGGDEHEFVAWVTAADLVRERGALVEMTWRGGGGGPYGEIDEFDLRVVDPHLNPYPGLLRDPLTEPE